jgi:RNA polymerase sigma-70 factor (ECF subfamily)
MTIQAQRLRETLLAGAGAIARRASPELHAFIHFYDEYFPRVYNYARYRCGDPACADDLTAQVFERALTRLDDFDPQIAPFGAWLFAIARNLVNNYLRAESRSVWLPIDACERRPDVAAGPEERIIRAESQAALLQALARLSERERDLLSLKFAAGLTNRRIAEIVGLSETNVGVIVYRALHRLRVLLDERTDPHV